MSEHLIQDRKRPEEAISIQRTNQKELRCQLLEKGLKKARFQERANRKNRAAQHDKKPKFEIFGHKMASLAALMPLQCIPNE